MPIVTIEPLVERFPDFRLALIVARAIHNAPDRSPALRDDVAATEAACRLRWGATELSAIPGVAAWRSAYRGFGIKKTSYRSSVERLIKRVLAGGALPEINALVDAYNVASLASGLCLGCDDLDKTSGDLSFRYAQPGDTFIDMGAEAGEDPNDPPKPGEVVYADARHVLCRRWNWRQDARSMATLETRNAALTVQSNGHGDIEAAATALAAVIERDCGGRTAIVVVDHARPTATF